jgi:hypothetical protein
VGGHARRDPDELEDDQEPYTADAAGLPRFREGGTLPLVCDAPDGKRTSTDGIKREALCAKRIMQHVQLHKQSQQPATARQHDETGT